MTTPQKRHRERAAEARAFFMRANPSLQHWLETGEWLPSTEPPYFTDEEQQHDRFAQALADTEAETTAELGKVLVRDLGALASALAGDNETRFAGPAHLVAMLATGKALAIPLPECSVAHNRLVRAGTSERLLRGTEDLERGVLSGGHGARFRPTLLLEPVEDERSGG